MHTLHDIVLYGASGFTGQLVAEYLGARVAAFPALRWALAGRDPAKLARVRTELGLPETVGLMVADSADPPSMRAMAGAARVVISTVGPYQRYGSELVAACAELGTDYVDLCGEPLWMRAMIDAHEAQAKRSGARIVFSCGFDSVPFDLGVQALQAEFVTRFGKPAPRVRGRVRQMKGTWSGGTAASLKATMAVVMADPRAMDLLRDPFALTPGFIGAEQPRGTKPMEEPDLGSWSAPFVMAAINTRNVHRSNLLMAQAYGSDFRYDEMVLTGPGEKGAARAQALAADRSMSSDDGPKPGEGPSKAEREAGHYDLLFVADGDAGQQLRLGVKGDRDPGYGSTSKMISEAALCLLDDALQTPGGIWTPAPALGVPYREALEAYAGLSFRFE